jgi:hypothetical protein
MGNMCGGRLVVGGGNMCGNRLFEGVSITPVIGAAEEAARARDAAADAATAVGVSYVPGIGLLSMNGSVSVEIHPTNDRDLLDTFSTEPYQTSANLRVAGIKGLSFQKSNSILGAAGRAVYGAVDWFGDLISNNPNKGKNTNLLIEVDPIDSMRELTNTWHIYLKESGGNDDDKYELSRNGAHSLGDENALNIYDVWDTSYIRKIDYKSENTRNIIENPYITLNFKDNYPLPLKQAVNLVLGELGQPQMSKNNPKEVRVQFDFTDGRLWLPAGRTVELMKKKIYLENQSTF